MLAEEEGEQEEQEVVPGEDEEVDAVDEEVTEADDLTGVGAQDVHHHKKLNMTIMQIQAETNT